MKNYFISLSKTLLISFLFFFISQNSYAQQCKQNGGGHDCYENSMYWLAPYDPNSVATNKYFPDFHSAATLQAQILFNLYPYYNTILWTPDPSISSTYTNQYSDNHGQVVVYGWLSNVQAYTSGSQDVNNLKTFCPNNQSAFLESNSSSPNKVIAYCGLPLSSNNLLNGGFTGYSGKDNVPACQTCTTNPINLQTGVHQKYIIDTQNNTAFPIIWGRYYNGYSNIWTFNYSQKLSYDATISTSTAGATLFREDGSSIYFTAPIVSGSTQSYIWSPQFSGGGGKNQGILGVLSDVKDSSGNIIEFDYHNILDQVEKYNVSGQLLSITDKAGNTQIMSYSNNQLSSISDNFGNTLNITYGAPSTGSVNVVNYDPNNPGHQTGTSTLNYNYIDQSINQIVNVAQIANVQFNNDTNTLIQYNYTPIANTSNLGLITQVNYPDNTNIKYVYNTATNTQYGLTQVVDQKGNVINNYTNYGTKVNEEDQGTDSQGKKINQVNILFQGSLNTLTDSLGNSVNVFNNVTGGSANYYGSSVPCPTGVCSGMNTVRTVAYDNFQNPTSLTDFNGNITTYTYDTTRGLVLTQTQASNNTTLSRTTTYTWNSQFRLVNTMTEPIVVNGVSGTRLTNNTYDSYGNLTNVVVSNSINSEVHNYSFTYNSFGQVVTATDSNNNTTTYNYLANGNLSNIVNALGQTIATYSNYDSHSTPHTIVDANGLTYHVAYDNLQKPTSISIGSDSTHYETTSIVYESTGKISKIQSADGSYLLMNYDKAQRLTSIQDYDNTGVLKGSIVFTLDAMSNITKTQFLDGAGNIVKSSTAQYNQYNWLSKTIGSLNQTTTLTYDNNQNITKIVDPLNRSATNTYDSLNRLTKIALANASNITLGNIQYGYDVQDNITSITDQNNHITNYYYDSFDRNIKIISPDTGTTQYTYDLMGNVKTKLDANSNLTTNTYDALNRITQKIYTNASNTQIITQTFTYDNCTNGVGHLCTITDNSGTINYNYDLWGRLTSKVQVVNNNTQTINYSYNNVGQLTNMIYPSGMDVTYLYDNNQINTITTTINGTTTTLLSNASYQPMSNLVSNFTWGNGTIYSRSYDTDYNIQNINNSGSSFNNTFTVDNVGNIKSINNGTYNLSYTYNDQDQLLTMSNTTASSNQYSFTYDLNGNRKTQTTTVNSSASTTNYTISSTSNILNSLSGAISKTYQYDANGNLVNDGTITYSYDNTNRLISSTKNLITTNYLMNALGQRVEKNNSNTTTYFAYNSTSANMIGEYDANNNVENEYIYLDNQIVGVVNNNNLYYVITDQINTPRQIIDGSNNTVWQWDNNDPFGNNQATLSTLNFNLRFPGQYFDTETNLNYNYTRNYDSSIGRYIQSDILGLTGGINGYSYTSQNPIKYFDKLAYLLQLSNGDYIFSSFSLLNTPTQYNYSNYFTTFDLSQKNFFDISNLSKNPQVLAEYGYLFTDKGTPIRAYQRLKSTPNPNGLNYDADCHGVSFTNGKYWIDNDQVSTILKDEYSEVNYAQVQSGDIAIYRDLDNNIVHSVTVVIQPIPEGGIHLAGYGKGGNEPAPYYGNLGAMSQNSMWPDAATLSFYRKLK
jgi:RHS repeat-associated protein